MNGAGKAAQPPGTGRGRIKLTVLAVVLSLVAACGGGDVAATDDGIDVVPVHTSERPIDNLGDITDRSDALIHGRLIEVIERFRYTTDDDEGVIAFGIRDEFAGLVFELQEVLAGEVNAEMVTVQWMTYQVDASTKERQRRLIINDVDMLDPSFIGQEFLLPIIYHPSIDNYQMTSRKVLASVGTDSVLTGVSKDYVLGDFGIRSIADLRDDLQSR